MVESGASAGLTVLLQALAGGHGQVQWLPVRPPDAPARQSSRPVLDDAHLLLPAKMLPELQPAAVAHAAAHWLFSTPHQPVGDLKPISCLVMASIEDARVEHLLAQQLPGVSQWFLRGLSAHRAAGLGFADLLARMSRALWEPAWIDPNPWVNKARDSVRRAVEAHGWHDAVALRQVAAVLANDLGQMRVRLDLSTFVEPTPYRDDHSWLWQAQACSDDEQMLDAGQAPLSAPAPEEMPATPPPPRIWMYPEWDHRTHHLRADWSTVFERIPAIAPGASTSGGVALHFPTGRGVRTRLGRQVAGDALDLEACTRFAAERRHAAVPEPRVFQRHLRRPCSAAVLVLMDLSASTGDALPGDTSMLALEKQAALLLARATGAQQRRLALHGFSSNTRHAVHYWRLLDFGEPLGDAGQRLQAAAASHSTRLGAAVRHATSLLARQLAEQRLLLVLTDGVPSDIDVADPRYLVEDARHAVIGARRRGIEVACLATDHGAGTTLVRMFGRRFTRVARTPQHLPAQLVALHRQLAR